jgi:hypothetical protein
MEKGICLLRQIPFPEKMLGFDTYLTSTIVFVIERSLVLNV